MAVDLARRVPAAAPPVELRTGDHQGFGRIVLDWPQRVGYEASASGRSWRIVFDRAADIDAAAIGQRFPSLLEEAASARGDGRSELRLALKAGVRAKVFELEGGRVVIDLHAPVGAAAAAPAASRIVPPAVPVEASGPALAEPGAGAAMPVEPQPESSGEGPAPAAPLTLRVGAAGDAPGAALDFAWSRPLPAAFLIRAGYLWSVFARRPARRSSCRRRFPSPLPGQLGPGELIDASGGIALRFALRRSAGRDGRALRGRLAGRRSVRRRAPPQAVRIERAEGPPRLRILAEEAGASGPADRSRGRRPAGPLAAACRRARAAVGAPSGRARAAADRCRGWRGAPAAMICGSRCARMRSSWWRAAVCVSRRAPGRARTAATAPASPADRRHGRCGHAGGPAGAPPPQPAWIDRAAPAGRDEPAWPPPARSRRRANPRQALRRAAGGAGSRQAGRAGRAAGPGRTAGATAAPGHRTGRRFRSVSPMPPAAARAPPARPRPLRQRVARPERAPAADRAGGAGRAAARPAGARALVPRARAGARKRWRCSRRRAPPIPARRRCRTSSPGNRLAGAAALLQGRLDDAERARGAGARSRSGGRAVAGRPGRGARGLAARRARARAREDAAGALSAGAAAAPWPARRAGCDRGRQPRSGEAGAERAGDARAQPRSACPARLPRRSGAGAAGRDRAGGRDLARPGGRRRPRQPRQGGLRPRAAAARRRPPWPRRGRGQPGARRARCGVAIPGKRGCSRGWRSSIGRAATVPRSSAPGRIC